MPELIYVGAAWLPGVPARDLTAEEVEQHGHKRLLTSGLYVEPERGPDDEATDLDAVAEAQEIAHDGRENTVQTDEEE